MLPGLNGQVLVDGQFTSVKHQNVILAIKELYPDIEVAWIPPASRQNDNSPAFRVSYEPVGQQPFILFFVKEEDFDERVLMRIIQNDQTKQKVTISDLEAWERAREAVARQEWLDELEAINDIAYHVFRTHKNTYKVGDNLVIKEGIPHNAAYLDEKNRPRKGAPRFNIRDVT